MKEGGGGRGAEMKDRGHISGTIRRFINKSSKFGKRGELEELN